MDKQLPLHEFPIKITISKMFLMVYYLPPMQGDGPKLVRELFRVAEEHAPSIVFIDEIDAIGTKRQVYRLRRNTCTGVDSCCVLY